MREKAETPSPNSNCCRKPLSHLAVGLGNADLGRFSRRQCRHAFSGISRKTGEFGNLNLWFPNSSTELAAASGCRLSLPESAAPTCVFRGIPENRRIRELEFMVSEFVDRTGGSKWLSALPTGGSKWVQAQPAGSEWVQAQPARPSRSSAASCAAHPSPQPAGLPFQAAS